MIGRPSNRVSPTTIDESETQAVTLFEALARDISQYFRMGCFRCVKRLPNGAIVRIEIVTPPIRKVEGMFKNG